MRALSIGLFALAIVPAAAKAAEHPPVLDDQDGCQRWIGGASGNDPSVRIVLRLCPKEGGGVGGQSQWSSLESGWNVRVVDGAWDGDRLTLRDVRIAEERPNPGWRFCTIDRWDLRRSGDRLNGSYTSTACDDHARVSLRLMQEPAQGGGAATNQERPPNEQPAQPPSSDEAVVPTPPTTTDPPRRDPIAPGTPPSRPPPQQAGWGCSVSIAAGAGVPAWPSIAAMLGLALSWAAARARRRSAARRAS